MTLTDQQRDRRREKRLLRRRRERTSNKTETQSDAGNAVNSGTTQEVTMATAPLPTTTAAPTSSFATNLAPQISSFPAEPTPATNAFSSASLQPPLPQHLSPEVIPTITADETNNAPGIPGTIDNMDTTNTAFSSHPATLDLAETTPLTTSALSQHDPNFASTESRNSSSSPEPLEDEEVVPAAPNEAELIALTGNMGIRNKNHPIPQRGAMTWSIETRVGNNAAQYAYRMGFRAGEYSTRTIIDVDAIDEEGEEEGEEEGREVIEIEDSDEEAEKMSVGSGAAAG
ncbi:uncharacterized protein KY384_004664 [Bacidia gigantensis]|uniref:uncharacterized protein n=1 Tax=Bacidia gigantensis TaxID=2732470 RepID=UPI001D039C29|nr:uncharacterized protein KY384_004664 [Bacidia gigantensis]KAG8530626.1 hypothetical protein KY384_004664 [Bacidia gigantensis]